MSILGSNGIYEYSIGAKLAYDNMTEEIYLINPAYSYSYAYHIPSKAWIKRGESFSKVFNINGESYGYKESTQNIYRLFEQFGDGIFPVMLETKPISIDTPDFKKINRIIIRGQFEPCNGKLDNYPSIDKFIGAYLWGSQDGRNYNLLQPKQIDKTCNDIVFKRLPMSVKFFVIILCGHLTSDSYISHIDVDWDSVYNDKIR